MPLLRHVRLLPHKGLKGTILTGLEKTNVVCGPNNSGKTTVLECIADPKLCVPGMEISREQAMEIGRQGLGGVGWGRAEPRLDSQYVKSVQEAIAREPVWFSDDAARLVGKIDWGFFGGWHNPQGSLSKVFSSVFAKLPSAVLVPAKRRLEVLKKVQASDGIQPDGRGILNFLFAAKNQDESSEVRRSFDQICGAFGDIWVGCEFGVFIQQSSDVELRFRRQGDLWRPANDCGLGLQDLLIVLYFSLASQHDIVLIEEPENHLHPEIQRRLMSFLRKQTAKQFFLSTHSNIFLDAQFADRVFLCRMTDCVEVENATSRAHLLAELGYSIADNLVSDVIVLCEGPKDKLVLDEFFTKMGLADRYSIKVWPLGGDIMDQVDLSVFSQSYQVIALVDKDPGSAKIRNRFLKKCSDHNIPVHQLERYAIENYFSMAAIAVVMGGQMPAGLSGIDPEKPVSDQLGFELKKNGGRIAREMKLEDVKGTDFESFLKRVESLAAQGRKK